MYFQRYSLTSIIILDCRCNIHDSINIHILYCSLLQSKNNGILLNEMPPLPLEQPQTQTKYIVFECFPKYESQKPTEPE